MATTVTAPAPGALGAELTRIEGREKVMGRAVYAYEHDVEGAVYAWIVQATIARGAVGAVDGSEARRRPGVLAVLSHENAPKLGDPAERELAAVELEPLAPGLAAHSTYRKVRDRASFSFAVVSVAAALDVDDGTVRDCRIALGGVAHGPWRAWRAEEELRGGPATPERFAAAAEAELAQARPLRDNAFKVPLARNLITSTLASLAGERA